MSAIGNLSVAFEATPYKPQGRYGNRVVNWAVGAVHDRVKDALLSPVRERVYYATSKKFAKKLNETRLEESREFLRSIGGESIVIKTADGTLIEGMYVDVKRFKKALMDAGIQFEYRKNNQGKDVQVVRVFSNLGAQILKKLRIKSVEGIIYDEVELPRDGSAVDRIDHSKPRVTIITQGNASIFEFDRKRIGDVLLSGQSCVAFNIRGTGRSTGNISEKGTYEDIESVYQFLKQSKKYTNSQITVLGYCLGGGYASNLAANHPGINLTLDRSYERVADIVAESACDILFPEERNPFFATAEKITRYTISRFVNLFMIGYDNVSRIKRVKGHVCIVEATEDDLIPKGSADGLKKGALQAKARGGIQLKDKGHNDSWTTQAKVEYAIHLRKASVLRDFGRTPRPSFFGQRTRDLGIVVRGMSQSASQSTNKSRVSAQMQSEIASGGVAAKRMLSSVAN